MTFADGLLEVDVAFQATICFGEPELSVCELYEPTKPTSGRLDAALPQLDEPLRGGRLHIFQFRESRSIHSGFRVTASWNGRDSPLQHEDSEEPRPARAACD